MGKCCTWSLLLLALSYFDPFTIFLSQFYFYNSILYSNLHLKEIFNTYLSLKNQINIFLTQMHSCINTNTLKSNTHLIFYFIKVIMYKYNPFIKYSW